MHGTLPIFLSGLGCAEGCWGCRSTFETGFVPPGSSCHPLFSELPLPIKDSMDTIFHSHLCEIDGAGCQRGKLD